MLISTAQELQQYLPSHNMDNIDSMMGFLDNSEHDFLMERIGSPLHRYLTEQYAELLKQDRLVDLIPPFESPLRPTLLLITLCQRVIVFDTFARSANIRALSVNASGFNASSADDYDVASPESIKAFKSQCAIESHAAVNRLLLQLEEWAKTDSEKIQNDGEIEEKKKLVDLWRSSPYFYHVEGLLINTASALSEYLDIFDSREKFIQMTPDLRYIQEVVLTAEIGDDLLEDLTKKNLDGKGNNNERKSIRLLKRAMALLLEDRSRFFKREAAHSEAIQAINSAKNFIAAHVADFDSKCVGTSPFAELESSAQDNADAWQNNRKGNVIFATRPLH